MRKIYVPYIRRKWSNFTDKIKCINKRKRDK